MRKSFKILLISILAVILLCTLFACGKDTGRPYPTRPQPPQVEELVPDGTIVDGTPTFNPGKPVYLSPIYVEKSLSPSSNVKGSVLPMQYKNLGPDKKVFNYDMIKFQVIGKVGKDNYSAIKFKTTVDGNEVDSLPLSDLANNGSIVIDSIPSVDSNSLPEINSSGQVTLDFTAKVLYVENSKHEFVKTENLSGRVKIYLGKYYNDITNEITLDIPQGVTFNGQNVETAKKFKETLMVGDVISYSKFSSMFQVVYNGGKPQAIKGWDVQTYTKNDEALARYFFTSAAEKAEYDKNEGGVEIKNEAITSITVEKDVKYVFKPIAVDDVVIVTFVVPAIIEGSNIVSVELSFSRNDSIITIPKEIEDALKNIENAGYKFVGLYTEDGEKWDKSSNFGNRKRITLTAKFEQETYSLTIYLRGTRFSETEVTYSSGAKATATTTQTQLVNAYPSFQKQSPFGMNIIKIDGLQKGQPYNSYKFNTWLNCYEAVDKDVEPNVKKQYLIPGELEIGSLTKHMFKPEDGEVNENGIKIHDKLFYTEPKFFDGSNNLIDLSEDSAIVNGDLVLFTEWYLNDLSKDPEQQKAYDEEILFKNPNNYTVKADGTVRLDKIENYYIEELHIPADYNEMPITEIGDYLCQNFTGLRKLDLSDATNLEIIGERAFANCSKLKASGIITPKPVNATTTAEPKAESKTLKLKTIRKEAFEGTPFAATNGPVQIGSVLITYNNVPANLSLDGIETIAAGCFEGKGLTGVIELKNIKRIYERAFANNAITGIKINEVKNEKMVLEYVAPNAFENNNDIINSQESILFEQNRYLYKAKGVSSTYDIGATIEIIGAEAFANLNGLNDLTGGANVREIYQDAFKGTGFLLKSTNEGQKTTNATKTYSANGFVVVNNILCNYTGDETTVQIPNRITAIAPFAFSSYNNEDVTEIIMAPTVKQIGEYAFFDALKKLNISTGNARIYFPVKTYIDKVNDKVQLSTKGIDIKPTAFANAKGEINDNLMFYFSYDSNGMTNESFGTGEDDKPLSYLGILHSNPNNAYRFKSFRTLGIEFNKKIIETEYLIGLDEINDKDIEEQLSDGTSNTSEAFLEFAKKHILKGQVFSDLPNEIFNGIIQKYIDVDDKGENSANVVAAKTGLILEATNQDASIGTIELSFSKGQDAKNPSLIYTVESGGKDIGEANIDITINYTIDGIETSEKGVTTIKVNGSDKVYFNDGSNDYNGEVFEGGPFRLIEGKSYLFEKTKIKDSNLQIKFKRFGGKEIIVTVKDIPNVDRFMTYESDIKGGAVNQTFALEYPVSRNVTYRFEYDYVIQEVEYDRIERKQGETTPVEIGINGTLFDASNDFVLVKNNGDTKVPNFNSKTLRIESIENYNVPDFSDPKLPELGGGHVKAKYNIGGKSLDFSFDFKVYMSADPSDFKFEIKGDEAYITGFRKFTNQTMMIPSYYVVVDKTYPVVGIDLRTTNSNQVINEIGMPSTIKLIGKQAFEGWGKLQRIGYYKAKTDNGDYRTRLYKEDFDGGETAKNEFPEDLTSIGNSAFANTALKEIVLNKWVNSIEVYAFGNTPITRADISRCAELNYIGTQAFYNCNQLETVDLYNPEQDNIERWIGTSAFYNCYKLSTVNNLNKWKLANGAFNNCPALIPIGDGSGFVNCAPMPTIEGSDLLVENGVIVGFKNELSTNREYLTIPSKMYNGDTAIDIVGIKENAFKDNTKLKYVVLPASVTEIGANAFNGCTGLTGITIPASVTTIGVNAFSGCTGLTSITIPASVTKIGVNAFSGCINLVEIIVDKQNATYKAEGNCIIEKATNKLVVGCKTSVIPASVTEIDANAFSGCTGLTGITIPASVTTIGANAFRGCTGLTEIIIPASVTTIGVNAFNGCTQLKTIIIPAEITKIGNDAFVGVPKVYYMGNSEDWGKISLGTFNGTTVYYYSLNEPAKVPGGTAYNGNYWHYVDGVVTEWVVK